MTDLNKVNFMSKERFDNLSYTNDDELYVVETVVPDDSEVVHVFGNETIDGVKTFTSVPLSVTPSASSNNGSVATTEWVSNPTLSTNVVHRSGNETITGQKTFNGVNNVVNYKSTEIDKTTAPNSNLYIYTDYLDKNNQRIGVIGSRMHPNGYYGAYLQAGNEGTIFVVSNGTDVVTYAPTPADSNSTTSNNIATVGWVNDATKSTNVVHRSGDETISGTKTFNNTILSVPNTILISKNSNYTMGATPSSVIDKIITFQDSANENDAYIQQLANTDGWNHLYLSARNKKSDNTIVSSLLDLRAKTDGTVEMSGITPASVTDNTNKIATTAHLINVLKAIYPVGSLYMGTQASCPMSSFFGTWELVSSGKALWTGNGTSGSGTTTNANYANAPANTTINAGLPDPDVDVIYRQDSTSSGVYSDKFGTDGWTGSSYSNTGGTDEWMQSSKDKGKTRPLAAIFTNSIYGASTTVQPPAYVVNVWRRTA